MNLNIGTVIASATAIGTLANGPASQVAFAQSPPEMSREAVEKGVAAFAAQLAANPPSYPNLTFVAVEARELTLFVHLRFNEKQGASDETYSSQMVASQCRNPGLRQFVDQYGVVFDMRIDAVDGRSSHRFQIDRAACARTASVVTAPLAAQARSASGPVPTLARLPIGPPLTREELVTGARQLQAWKPRDQFSAPPGGPQFAGRVFQYALPISPRISRISLAICSSLPHWGYSAALQELEVTFPEGLASPLGASADNDAVLSKIEQDSGNYVHFLPLVCGAREGASYPAHNALGAETTVFSSREASIGVGYADLLSNDRLGFFLLKVAMPPELARVVTKNLRIIVTGEIGEWLPGVSLVCGRDSGRPTFDSPFDNSYSACVYRATVAKIEVVDGTTGQVLATHRP